jgi:predicted lipid-binding transport protein (Tim44 family)
MLVVMLALGSLNAEAKRLGGGKSMGQQSSRVTQREAAAPNRSAQGATTPAAPPNAPLPAPRRPWGAMLGGLAAGLGLAWLASSLGLGEAMGQMLMFGLLAAGVMLVVGMVLRARAAKSAGPGVRGAMAAPLVFGGAAAAPAGAATPPQYNAAHLGNDAAARPWERNSTAFEARQYASQAAGGSMIGAALAGPQSWGIPADFDRAGFVDAAKRNFVSLQDAWDRSDIPALRAMMTDGMLTEIKAQLAERTSHVGPSNKTEVVMLDAQLLGIEELDACYLASVEFNGMIREEPSAGPSPFREVWNMTKSKAGGGWLVAGVQALQ